MAKPIIIALILMLAGCSGIPRAPNVSSPCYANESSYECQLERYHNVNV
ncbi:MAG: hypothetical protein K0Q43_5087 [Ramlibacter sp.]|jgi:hypothetical protein|nr:hypothetical protein [Ramlibacter sp.]